MEQSKAVVSKCGVQNQCPAIKGLWGFHVSQDRSKRKAIVIRHRGCQPTFLGELVVWPVMRGVLRSAHDLRLMLTA
jgi:hypothetical protein